MSPDAARARSHGFRLGDPVVQREFVEALIVEEQEDAYRVRNPVNQTVGWVGRREVARTVRLDVATLQPC